MTTEGMQIKGSEVNNDGFFFDFDSVQTTHKSVTRNVATSDKFAKVASFTYLQSFPWHRISTRQHSPLHSWYSLYPNDKCTTQQQQRAINVQSTNQSKQTEVQKNKHAKSQNQKSKTHKHRQSEHTMQTKPLYLWLESSLPCSQKSQQHKLKQHCAHDYVICYQSPPSTSLLTQNNNQSISTSTTKSSSVHCHDERDIIPGKYYGGLKVWSCAPMLARYLVEHEQEWRAKWRKSLGDVQHTQQNNEACSVNKVGNVGKNSRLQDNQCIVMEVGCGQGLCGLTAMCLGAQHIIFQDYNAQVLTSCVQPNVAATLIRNKANSQCVCQQQLLSQLQQSHYQKQHQQQQQQCYHNNNQEKDSMSSVSTSTCFCSKSNSNGDNFCLQDFQIKLVHGDWATLSAHPCNNNSNNNNQRMFSKSSMETKTQQSDVCDVILGSDVTFDEEACAKLAALLSRILKPGTGVALIASKQYYFGTNGGVWEFTQQATAHGLCVTEIYRVSEAQTSGMQQVIVQVTKQQNRD